jgi:hypothetical protein
MPYNPSHSGLNMLPFTAKQELVVEKKGGNLAPNPIKGICMSLSNASITDIVM